MKKTLFFLFGALLVAMLPTTKVDAQSSGHNVTWKNWDYQNHDTTINYNYADNKIRPRMSSPYGPASDTLLIDWFVDSTLTTPWSFFNDELTSDTTLWPLWMVLQSTQTVYHVVRNVQDTVDAVSFPIALDTILVLGTPGQPLTITPPPLNGFTPFLSSVVIPSMPLTDTMIHLNYTRNKYSVTVNLKGGHFTDGTPQYKTYYYGQRTNLLSNNVVRDSSTFRRWGIGNSYILSTSFFMPAHDVTISALYYYRPIWSNVDSVVYNGQPVSDLYAYYVDDNGFNIPTTLHYQLGGVDVSNATGVGTYRVAAVTNDPINYPLEADTVRFLKVKPFMLTISGTQVDSVKYYDGNSIANVTNPGSANTFGSDAVTLGATARFNDAAVSNNKSIIAQYTIAGADAANYLVPDTMLITTNGAILDRIQLQFPFFDIDANGYCGTVTIGYNLFSGNPNQYRVYFDDDALAHGFVNEGWQNITTPGSITFDIPEQAAGHWYSPSVQLRNSAYPDFVSDTTLFPPFHANLPNTAVVALFNNVLSIVDTCNCFSDFQWYHDGAPIPGANEAWYEDPNGLSGNYHVVASMYGEPTWTCDSAYSFTPAAAETTVSTYPNPATSIVTVSLTNSPDFSHSLVVMNVMGMTVLNTTFNGNDTDIDLRGLPQGSYTVIVDGIVTRVIKR